MRREAQRGIGATTVLLVVAAVGMIYVIVALGPAYYNNLEAKQAMREVANLAIQERSPERLTYELRKRFGRIGVYFEEREGEQVQVSPIEVDEENIEIDRNEDTKFIVIRVHYEREVRLPVLGQVVTLNFTPEITGDTTPVKW